MLKFPFLETLKVEKMRFIAPWIASVAISGCSKNDKTTATNAATVGNLKKAPEAQKAVGTIGKNSEGKSIENGTDEGRLLKGDGFLQGSPDVVVINGIIHQWLFLRSLRPTDPIHLNRKVLEMFLTKKLLFQ